MTTLHTIFSDAGFVACGAVAESGDSALLLGAAAVRASLPPSLPTDWPGDIPVFILAPASQVPPGMTAADYARFVRLATDHERVMSWD